MDHFKLTEKYNPSFRLERFSSEEGREKVVKKFKEMLDKAKITYDESIFTMLFPKDNRETELAEIILSKAFKETSEKEPSQIRLEIEKPLEMEDEVLKSSFLDDYPNSNILNFQSNKIRFPQEKITSNPEGLRVAPEAYKIHNKLSLAAVSAYYMHPNGFKLPIAGSKYLVKQYDKDDFPEFD